MNMSMNNAPLTAEERALRLKLHADGLTNKEIAKAIGVEPKTIYTWLRYYGLKSNKSSRVRNIEKADARRKALFAQGLSVDEIARLENVKPDTIRMWQFKVGSRKNKSFTPNDVSKHPEHERLFLREFFTDLLNAYKQCNTKPDIRRFMYVWSIEKGGRRETEWYVRNNKKARSTAQDGCSTGSTVCSRHQTR